MTLYGPGIRWLLLIGTSSVLVFLFVFFTSTTPDGVDVESPIVLPDKTLPEKLNKPPAPITLTGSRPVSQLPSEYVEVLDPQPDFCKDRFGIPYLEKLRDSAVEYCATGSPSQVTCFHSATAEDHHVDSFCLASGAVYEGDAYRYRLGCKLAELPTKLANIPHVPALNKLQAYWYETGPGIVFKRIEVDEEFKPVLPEPRVPQYTLLVKREGATNIWHSLIEIFSMTLSMDVLRMAQTTDRQAPFFASGDEYNTQVVLLDNAKEGPFFDLWSLFSKRPVVLLKDLPPGTHLENVIVPLAGASNPMWQGDWKVHSCQNSQILKMFSRRVLGFYKLQSSSTRKAADSPVVLTYINRAGSRRLVHGDEHFNRVASKYPHIKVQSIDFAGLPLQKQLEIIQGTDILVGVHGAGLTHGIFLPPNSAMVEILPYDFNHKGFRNMASLLDHEYFSVHASGATVVKRGDWHKDDVFIEEDRLMETIDTAVRVMHNRGQRNSDIN